MYCIIMFITINLHVLTSHDKHGSRVFSNGVNICSTYNYEVQQLWNVPPLSVIVTDVINVDNDTIVL